MGKRNVFHVYTEEKRAREGYTLCNDLSKTVDTRLV